ncbi:phage tail protein [Sphingomonas sp. HMP6]|uniref:phage tail protein n=1 Tax=Sphingomonas sp. HMP6 TaxID=1517551 RepID=UPI001596B7BC|nr:phage tail protein [Sphingomonas sp. HMP6]BCA57674.1 hypothetical protein HMP06_0443 [Sphingomonas sp. HMP6]
MGGKTTSTTATKLNSLAVQSSSLGLPINMGWGRGRITRANLIWYGGFNAISHTVTTRTGKGLGGGTKDTTFTYTASIILALGEGVIPNIVTVYRDTSVFTGGTALAQAGLSLATGTTTQPVWGYLTSRFPAQALNYSGIAYVYAQDYLLADSATLPNHSFEVDFAIQLGGGVVDADPKDIITDFLTSPSKGVPGWGAGLLGDLSDYSLYCRASNLLLSPVLESQQPANTSILEWMQCTNSAIYWSEGVLKIRPYGDAAATANGVTWTPDMTPAYDLTEDDFEDDDIPVRLAIIDQTEAFNQAQVEFLDRGHQYNTAIAPAYDLGNIIEFGARKQDPISLHAICDPAVAQNVVQLILQRALYVREEYTFSLPWNFVLLEPTSLVTLTTTTDELKLTRVLVRIKEITEDEDGKLSFVAEGVPGATASAATYSSHSGSGYSPNAAVAPGSVSAPFLFLAPTNLSGFNSEIWLAAASTSATWGGCEVWISGDNIAYSRVGRIEGPARYGTLTAALASHADPDTVNTLAVDLSTSLGTLSGTTAAGMASGATLAIIDGEVIGYQNATLTGANRYSLAPLARGQRGTAPAAHASGAKFARLDDAIFKFGYDQAVIGDTIYVKLPSFNIFGGALQDISTVAIYSIAVPNAASRFQAALNDIAAITSDSILSRGSEKQRTNLDYQAILNDLAALDARYTALGSPADLTSSKATADAAVAALTAYLTGLTPSWTDPLTDTPIVAATFVAKFTDVYTKLSLFRAAITGRPGTTQRGIYLRSLPTPATPTGNAPAGWIDSIPAGTDTLWQSLGYFDAMGSLIGIWAAPRAISTNAPVGTYSSSTVYYVTNNVGFNGGTYTALQDNFSNQAPSGTSSANAYWGVISAPGSAGTPATPPGAFAATLALTSGAAINLRTVADAAGYTGFSNATITFNVPSGVTIRGLSSGGIGIDTGNWPTSSYTIALTLVVQSGGIVDGGGGAGGAGNSGNGAGGGDAIYVQVPMTGGITINSGGTLRAGGGGGGGGASYFTGGAEPSRDGGGGGGGGAPNGAGAGGFRGNTTSGGNGSAGTTSGGGAGGAAGAAGAGAGAAGGGFGAAGGSSTGGTSGAAGYAVRKNGNAVTVSNSGTMTGTAA